ncbi:hypothetical protein FHL15_010264 [Xylaria flabelliformis]|uniref:F-box domain-containing protein n=1 Tax=Xylaria flabelliformis TaxID=2512241 RepID=A0A553HLG7_9PEZI|nr:hypothetical protein FHL15_010264 [Xylaria flabelliformis]
MEKFKALSLFGDGDATGKEMMLRNGKMSDTAEIPASFLSFLHLPSELRNEIYHLVLRYQDPIDPWVRGEFRRILQELTPGLLRANKAIHREASSLFYGTNRFNLSNAMPENVASFLDEIGSDNAGYIRHVLIRFPELPMLTAGDATLSEKSVSFLAVIQSRCTNLTTLKTSLDMTYHRELGLIDPYELGELEVVAEALQLVDTHFRAILSLQEIILEVYERDATDPIKRIVKNHGWTISEIEEDEDWYMAYRDGDDYDDGYDDIFGDDDDVDDDEGDDDIDDIDDY